jgi:hypothetical protein
LKGTRRAVHPVAPHRRMHAPSADTPLNCIKGFIKRRSEPSTQVLARTGAVGTQSASYASACRAAPHAQWWHGTASRTGPDTVWHKTSREACSCMPPSAALLQVLVWCCKCSRVAASTAFCSSRLLSRCRCSCSCAAAGAAASTQATRASRVASQALRSRSLRSFHCWPLLRCPLWRGETSSSSGASCRRAAAALASGGSRPGCGARWCRCLGSFGSPASVASASCARLGMDSPLKGQRHLRGGVTTEKNGV